MRNNKGIASVFIILGIVLLAVFLYLGFYFYSNKELPAFSTIEINEKSYNSVGFLKFKLPELDQNKIDEFLKNPENTKCFKKEYFKEVTFDEFNNISLTTFPENEDPLCMGAPGPYSNIQLNYIDSDFTKSDFKKPEFYTWVKDENLSTQRLNVFKNTNSYQAISREYFLIIDKESKKDDGITISISPSISEDSLEYQYAISLIKAFEIKERTEFTGLSNCREGECKNLDVSITFENTGIHKDESYVVRNYKISLTDTKTGNEYFKYVNPKLGIETESEIRDIRKFNNYIIFRYTISDVKDLNNSKETSKIGILDLTNGQIRDLIINPVGLRFQDYLVAGDDIFFITGDSCGEVCLEPNMKKYLLRYNFKNNQITQIFNKSLGELGVTESEATKFFELEKYNKNKIIMSVRQVIQPAFDFVEIDLATGEVKKLTKNFEISGEAKVAKQKELGVVKYNKLNITDGLLVESIEN
jgi:hypothetical protein